MTAPLNLGDNDFQLVIFDCDGVLVDSERISNRVFAQMLNEIGLPLSMDETIDRFMGRSMLDSMKIIGELLGRAPPENFTADYKERGRVAFVAELKSVQGIEVALKQIDRNYCVASSGDHEKMRTTLGITKLLPNFVDRMFSATQVARGKPAPDLFLFAAHSCGVAPSACVVIEDSPAGVAAGIAAGMTVFGYSAHTSAARLLEAGAHCVFHDMAELPSLVKRGTLTPPVPVAPPRPPPSPTSRQQ